MDKHQRNAISTAAQAARRLLEQEFREQLEGTYDIRSTGEVADLPGAHLGAAQRVIRTKLVAAIQYYESSGLSAEEAVARYVREAAFTALNRYVALKMLEARELLQQCVSAGVDSAGYREFIGLAPGVERLTDNGGYRLYLEALFDELSTEVKVLFDRRDASSLLWPRHNAFEALLDGLNDDALAAVWDNDETIGWFYQFFNSKEERQQMREESQAPRNSRELAVRNQFFTPRYVVQFLVDNTLARTWAEMADDSALLDGCEYFVELEDERPRRDFKDPRQFRILDPACGSGHFLLYAFDLLERMYREAWDRDLSSSSYAGDSLRTTYSSVAEIDRALPSLILEHNLHGIDIDPRAAQIAALALWLRAQRSWRDAGVASADRPPIRKTGIVVAEPMPGDGELVTEFADQLQPPLLGNLFRQIVASLSLAGEMGFLVRAETDLESEITRARAEFVAQRLRPQTLPGFQEIEQGELDLTGIDDDAFFAEAEQRLFDALSTFVSAASGEQNARRRLFADDSAHGVALLELLREHFDVVLMNPPFGAGSLKAKKVFDKTYPRTKNDVYAAFVALRD